MKLVDLGPKVVPLLFLTLFITQLGKLDSLSSKVGPFQLHHLLTLVITRMGPKVAPNFQILLMIVFGNLGNKVGSTAGPFQLHLLLVTMLINLISLCVKVGPCPCCHFLVIIFV